VMMQDCLVNNTAGASVQELTSLEHLFGFLSTRIPLQCSFIQQDNGIDVYCGKRLLATMHASVTQAHSHTNVRCLLRQGIIILRPHSFLALKLPTPLDLHIHALLTSECAPRCCRYGAKSPGERRSAHTCA